MPKILFKRNGRFFSYCTSFHSVYCVYCYVTVYYHYIVLVAMLVLSTSYWAASSYSNRGQSFDSPALPAGKPNNWRRQRDAPIVRPFAYLSVKTSNLSGQQDPVSARTIYCDRRLTCS